MTQTGTTRFCWTSSMSRYPLAVIWSLLLMSSAHSEEIQPTAASGVVDGRLVNGEGRCSGHLEMKHKGQWRTLKFRPSMDSSKAGFAEVVCRQLGCGSVVSVQHHTNTTVPRPAWELYFSCRGSEATIQQCKEAASRKKVENIESSVSSMEVVCSEFIRFVDKNWVCSGKVMVKSDQNWVHVCETESPKWTTEVSHTKEDMMCKELGCGSLRRSTLEILETGVASRIIQCFGNESRLEECATSTQSDCKSVLHISCNNPYSVRLVGGESRCRGFLEGKNELEWRPMSDSWGSLKEAQLINLCEELGCGTLRSSKRHYLNERQAVWEPSYDCDTTIFCKKWRDSDAYSALDIACTEAVKLTGGDRCTGFLNVKSDGSWRSFCQSQFTPQNALVACRDLGCGFPHEYKQRISPKSVSYTLNINCSGQEERLVDCPVSSLPAEATSDQCDAVFLSCKKVPTAPDMTIFSKPAKEEDKKINVYSGHRVLIICHVNLPYKVHSFKLKFYSRGKITERNQTAVDNTAHFLFDAVDADQDGHYYCSYNFDFAPEIFSEQVQYRLDVREASYVRLVGERSRCLGRLEVEQEHEWRPVSQHLSWSLKEAAVVCRQLGCGSVIRTETKTSFNEVQPVWRFYSDCDGSERALLGCGTVKDWLSTATIEVLCSDIVALPNITVLADRPYKEETNHVIVHEGHSFFINCSVEARFSGGHFTLTFTGATNLGMAQDAINHSTIFALNSVDKAYTGNYSCVYHNTVFEHSFIFKSKTVTITVEESRDVMLDDGVQRDDSTSACSGKLLVRDGTSEMRMVTAETSGWDMRHASIVCRQLGCGAAVSTSKIELQNFKSMLRFFSDCEGSVLEVALLECGHTSEWFSSTAIQVVCAGKS